MQRNKQNAASTARTLRWSGSAITLALALGACGGGSGTTGATADPGVPTDLATRGGLVAPARSALATGSNLLANPGFESGMANWDDWGNTLVAAGSGASGTAHALRVGTAAGGAGQSVTGMTAGATYRLTAQAFVSNPSDAIVIGVNMVDQYGTNVSQQAVRITNTVYSLASLDITVPANAVKALVYVWKDAGSGYAYVDELTFAAVGANTAAAAPSTTTSANLMSNPGFESSLQGWQNWGNASVVTGQSSSGSYALRVGTGAGGVGNMVSGIQSGKAYRITGQLKVSDASDVGYLGVAFLDSWGNHLQEQNVQAQSTGYTTAQVDMVAPPNASSALVYVWKNAGSGFVYADDIALVASGGASAPAAAPAPAPAAAPAPAPAPAPAGVDFGVVPLSSLPTTLLQAGRDSDAYWVEDGVWGPGNLQRGTYTGINGWTYEQYTGVSPVVGPNGEMAYRMAWKWPTGTTEVKSFPSVVKGNKPGWYNSWTKPGGFDVLLPNGSYSQVYPTGKTPGSFFPLQLPIASLKTSFSYKHMTPPTGRGHLSYDLFLQSSPAQSNSFGPSITHEIMVPLDYWGGYGTYPNRNPQWYDHDVTIDGILYHVYIVKDASGKVLSTFGSGWKFIVFEPDQPIQPGTIDMAKIVNYITTRTDAFGTPWANGNEYLVSAELGVEPVDGTGDIQVNNYRVWQ